MHIRETILQQIEALILVGSFSEQEICLLAMQYASQAYAEASHLRFVEWKDLEAIRKDLFGDEHAR